MKSFLISFLKITLFLISFYVISIIIAGLILPNPLKTNLIYTLGGNGHMYTRLQEVKERKDIDILFLGSSRAYRSFDTRIYDSLGYSSFNLGSSNQTPIQTKYLLEKYLQPLSPKIVIFEVNPDIFSNNGVESAIDIISNEKCSRDLVNMALEINNIKLYNTLVFSIFNQLTGNLKLFAENPQKENDLYIKNGFIESSDVPFDETKISEYNCTLNSLQLDAFNEIIEVLKFNKIEVYLVQSPILKSIYDSCKLNDEFDSRMNKLSNYINFNLFADFSDKQYFLDGQHLNRNGVIKFNQKLINLLF